MSWISLVCLLALTSSAFSRSSYGSGYGAAPSVPMEPLPTLNAYGSAPRTLLTPKVSHDVVSLPPVESPLPKIIESSGYGATPAPQIELPVQKPVESYGAAPVPRILPTPRVLPTPRFVSSYGSAPRVFSAP